MEWYGRSAHIRVKYLCETCNNGWMSDLEKEAQPVIRPLMNDISVPLDQWQQYLIALWTIRLQWYSNVRFRRGSGFIRRQTAIVS
jgi:hypothetical protein